MPMHELPALGLHSKDARHPDGQIGHFLVSSNLCFEALYFRNACQCVGHVLFDEFRARVSTVAIFGCGHGQSRFDVLAASAERTEGIAECHVLSRTEQTNVSTLVATDDRSERLVTGFNGAIKGWSG